MNSEAPDSWARTRRRLEPGELEPLYAPFLMAGGMGDEKFAFDWVEVDGRTARASCRITDYFKSPWDFEFHLNAVTGMALVSQMAMIHGMVVCGVHRKDFEILMMDYQQTLASLIREREGIQVSMTVVHRAVAPAGWRRRHPRTFFKWTFTLNEGAWSGSISAAFPFGPNGEGLDALRQEAGKKAE